MPKELQEQDLRLEILETGDRPSILALGLWGSQSLKRARMAVFAVDVLGRVQLMPPDAVRLLRSPRVEDELLDKLSVEEAINVMVKQEDPEDLILEYLTKRKSREAQDGSSHL
jgi:hypothetical protein